jgi:hypothetical protein
MRLRLRRAGNRTPRRAWPGLCLFFLRPQDGAQTRRPMQGGKMSGMWGRDREGELIS